MATSRKARTTRTAGKAGKAGKAGTGPKWPHGHTEKHRAAAQLGWARRRAQGPAAMKRPPKGQGKRAPREGLTTMGTAARRRQYHAVQLPSGSYAISSPLVLPRKPRARRGPSPEAQLVAMQGQEQRLVASYQRLAALGRTRQARAVFADIVQLRKRIRNKRSAIRRRERRSGASL